MGSEKDGRELVRKLTYALYADVGVTVLVLSLGAAYLFGWIGGNRIIGLVVLVCGFAGLSATVLLSRHRRRVAQYVETHPTFETAPAEEPRPLTYALVMALVLFIVGLVMGDAAIGIMSGIAGFAFGWVSALPIEKRRHNKPSNHA